MTAMISLLPQQTGSTFPAPNIPALNPLEQDILTGLSTKLMYQTSFMQVRNAYYEGEQRITNLGIAIPDQLANIRTVVDWPRICVDPLVMRTVVDSFATPDAPDIADQVTEILASNDFDAEFPLCALDELVYGRGYMMVGSPDVAGDDPLVTVESPLNVATNWDPRKRMTTAAYQAYELDGTFIAVLYLPDVTISMSRDSSGSGWVVDRRDQHNFGEVPVVRFANRMRAADREGRSEITPAIMNTTDSACRSLLGMEIAREFYSIPHRYILGASEADFVDAEGHPKTALSLSMNKFLALERDEEGNTPSVGQFQAFDPSVFTKIIDEHAQLMASYTQFPPSYFGQTTTANPSSADAIRTALEGRDRRRIQCQSQFSDPLERVMRLAWRFAHDGAPVPAEMRRMETAWVDASTETPTATAESMAKLVAGGILPPASDVLLEELGFTAVQRQRIKLDRQQDAGEELLAQLATSLEGKDARVNEAIATDLGQNGPQGPGGPPPAAAKTGAVIPVVPKPGPPGGK